MGKKKAQNNISSYTILLYLALLEKVRKAKDIEEKDSNSIFLHLAILFNCSDLLIFYAKIFKFVCILDGQCILCPLFFKKTNHVKYLDPDGRFTILKSFWSSFGENVNPQEMAAEMANYYANEVMVTVLELHGLAHARKTAKAGETFNYVDKIGYDAFGQRVYLKLGNGVETTYSYDENRRWLDAIQTKSGSTVLQNMVYKFDDVLNCIKTGKITII